MTPEATFTLLDGLSKNSSGSTAAFSPFKMKALVLNGCLVSQVSYTLKTIFKDRIGDMAILAYMGRVSGKITSLLGADDSFQLPYMTEGQREYLKRRFSVGDRMSIILTNDLRSRGFLLVKGLNTSIIQQLEQVVKFTEKYSFGSSDFIKAIDTFDGDIQWRSLNEGNTVAGVLADVIAVSLLTEDRKKIDEEVRFKAKRRVKTTLSRLKDAAKRGTESGAMDFFLDYRALIIDIMKVEPLVRESTFSVDMSRGLPQYGPSKSGYELYRLDPSVIKGVERESQRQFSLFDNGLYYRYEVQPSRGGQRFLGEDLDWFDKEYCSVEDFSIEGACLGKILEEEVNASVVQLIRELAFGIPMPDLYRRWDPNRDRCSVTTGRTRVDFNFRDTTRNILRMVPVGDVNASVRALLDEDSSWKEELGVFANQDYLGRTGSFAQYRNYSSHPGIVSGTEFKSMRGQFISLMQNYLKAIVRVKNELKSR